VPSNQRACQPLNTHHAVEPTRIPTFKHTGMIESITHQWRELYAQQLYQRFAGQWLVFGAMGGAFVMLGGLYYYIEANPTVRVSSLVPHAHPPLLVQHGFAPITARPPHIVLNSHTPLSLSFVDAPPTHPPTTSCSPHRTAPFTRHPLTAIHHCLYSTVSHQQLLVLNSHPHHLSSTDTPITHCSSTHRPPTTSCSSHRTPPFIRHSLTVTRHSRRPSRASW
jgi:hypothetical protein